MKKRDIALAHMRSAGYHDDRRSFTRLLCETRSVSREVANESFRQGANMRESGIKCDCYLCVKNEELKA